MSNFLDEEYCKKSLRFDLSRRPFMLMDVMERVAIFRRRFFQNWNVTFFYFREKKISERVKEKLPFSSVLLELPTVIPKKGLETPARGHPRKLTLHQLVRCQDPLNRPKPDYPGPPF
jgi:hypothetical protein